jgi:SSS family solute:Na+ symporter
MNETHVLHGFDYIILVSYFAVLIFIGTYFRKYIRAAKDYFAAGASVPWWLSSISLWMASFSATFFVIYSQIAFKYGLVAVVIAWVPIPAMVFAYFFFALRWRRARVITPLGFMTQRYNKVVHQVFVWTGFPLRLIDNALRILATAIFLVPAIGQGWFSLDVGIFVVGLLMITYAILGGQWAVLVTDFFQFSILCIAIIILFGVSLSTIGGFGGLVAGVQSGPEAPANFFKPMAPPYDFFYWIMFALVAFLSYIASCGLVQKYNCVPTENDAKKVALGMGVLSFLGPLVFFFPALAARAYLPKLMGVDVLGRSDEVYVLMALKVLPLGVMGVLVAGMFSATLSTLGNEYNVLSGVLTKDFYNRVLRPEADEKQIVRVGRINTAMIGLLTTLFALGLKYLKEVFNLIDILVKIFGAFGPAIMIPLLAGLVLKKVNSRGAIIGVTAGTISGVSLVILNGVLLAVYKDRVAVDPALSYWLKQGWNSAAIGINILATLLGMWIGSASYKPPEDERKRAQEFIARMDIPSVPDADTVEHKRSPFTLVGLALMIYGLILCGLAAWTALKGASLKVFGLNAAAGGAMIAVGLIMRAITSRKQSKT